MDLSEKVLYHQIHPVKLAADITGSVISNYLMWQRKFGPAMLGAWVPAILGSAVVLRFADLERLKHSSFGRYIRQFMTRRIEHCGVDVRSVAQRSNPRLNTGRWSAKREHSLVVIHTLHSELPSLQEEKDFESFVSFVFRF